ncbi:flagellar protein FliT [Ramlibacter sp.]|uniref:flagellar protein FliT n=1 Tax=Ramlibacter sp. TaxID=1917967 RepID=UPI003D113876
MPTFTPEARMATRGEPSEMLRQYLALERASEEMLRAARSGDWDSVCRIEGACTVIVTRLREQLLHGQPPAHEQAERTRILHAILANDAAVRELCQPSTSILDLEEIANSLPANKRLH